MTVDLDLHPQGVLEVQQNATAAVVCKVQHDGGQRVFTVFTWDGELLLVGHRHFNSGLLSTSFRNCSVTDEGRICEEFTLTIKAVSAANRSIVSCFSTNHSSEFRADGHVEILVNTDSISGVWQSTVVLSMSYSCMGSAHKLSSHNKTYALFMTCLCSHSYQC